MNNRQKNIPHKDSSLKGITIDKKIDLKQLLIDKIDSIWIKLLSNHNKCKSAFSEKSVHDLRVSIRRFQSLVFILSRLMPCPYLDDLRKTLRKEIKSFGALRDTQVQIKKVLSLRANFPILSSFYNDLVSREQFLIEEIQSNINQEDLTDLEGLVFFLKLYLAKNLLGNNLQGKVIMVTNDSFLDVKGKALAISPDSLASIHEVRLAFKKFRYIMEHLQKYYKINRAMMARHRKFQTMMGNIQDNVVLFGMLNDYIISHPEFPIKDYLPVLNHIAEEESRLVADFISHSPDLDTFWVISPQGIK